MLAETRKGRRRYRVLEPAFLGCLILVASQSAAVDVGQILLVDRGSNAVLEIDPETGDQSEIASGPPFVTLTGITFDAARRVIYVSDHGDGGSTPAAIYRVVPETGEVTPVSSGDLLLQPNSLLVESSRNSLLVADGGLGQLLRVNLFTGDQEIVADATAASGLLFAGSSSYYVTHTSGVAIQKFDLNDPDNPLVVGAAGSFQAPTGIGGPISGLHYVAEHGGGKLIEINLAGYNPDFPDANQTIVADDGDIATPFGVMRENAESVLVTDPGALAGNGAVIRYTPGTPAEEVVATGDWISDPRGISIVGTQIGWTLRPDFVLTNPDSATVSVWNPSANVLTPLASGAPLVSPTGVAVDPLNEHVLVADVDAGLASSGAIFEIDLEGEVTPLSSGGSLLDPVDLEVEADGSLVVADAGAGVVFRVDRSTGTQTPLASVGGLAAVTLAADGAIYAAGTSPVQVVRIPPEGGSFDVVAADGDLAAPTGLALDPEGRIAVLDAARVIRVDPETYDPGDKTANQEIVTDDGLPVNPTAIEIDESSNYALADPGADGGFGDLVTVFRSGGGFLPDVAEALGNVSGIALMRRLPRRGEIIVAPLNLKRLMRVDPHTGAQTVISSQGYLDKTTGVAIRDDRSAFVCTSAASILLVDLGTGQQRLLYTASGDPVANDTLLQDVALDSAGNAWVVDETDGNKNDVVFEGRIFRVDAETLAVTEEVYDPLLSGAKGLAIDDEDVLWIVASVTGIGVNTDKLLKYDPNGAEGVVQVASGQPLGQPGDVVFVPEGPFAGALFIPDNTKLLQVDRGDGTLSEVDTGGLLVGAFDAALDEEMNLITGGRFSPYNLVRHTLNSDGGETPSSVDQLLISRGGLLSTMAGLDVMRVPEPAASLAACAALATSAGLARRRRLARRG